eukprot:CAMPEP_0198117742 /NCGR_PEP_ID=MMETSP1442-20131203/19155_1 /TAXON_ID= /ORGANISM="Craspedostauros australis, Strain CCMP3328" /LENGTH=183 /DNA_ID=CAMNT_0043775857 /DNA_START=129 /DNA_END=676 /DNA_ORIENTATION=-
MGWFGGNKVKDESAAKSATRSPNDIENANLPVAVPIHAQVVHTPAAPPPQQPAYQAPPQPTIVQNNNVAASPPIQQLKPYKPNQQPPSMFLNDPVLETPSDDDEVLPHLRAGIANAHHHRSQLDDMAGLRRAVHSVLAILLGAAGGGCDEADGALLRAVQWIGGARGAHEGLLCAIQYLSVSI